MVRTGNGGPSVFDQEALDLNLFSVGLRRTQDASTKVAQTFQGAAEQVLFGSSTAQMEAKWRLSRAESRRRHAKSRRRRRLYRAGYITILVILILVGVVYFL